METTHDIQVGDARTLDLPDNSVEVVVTSPPYPMVEMWDDVFASLNAAIGEALKNGDGDTAFEAMHSILDDVWAEVERVLVDGGIACVNVGDATRTLDRFRVYRNHARIAETFEALGFDPLPDVLWRKPTNSAAKFMGSGMLPPNAYVTLEHEHILVFRNGDRRSFESGADRRYEAAYFWEERNRWFSDIWTDVTGTMQTLDDDDLRERSAAFPFEIPFRLVNMYSVYGDTVLDPFWGTGTTSIAALAAARNSVGVELDKGFATAFDDRVREIPDISRKVAEQRLSAHREFVTEQQEDGESLNYGAINYDFPVTTKQERNLQFYTVDAIKETPDGYQATHEPV